MPNNRPNIFSEYLNLGLEAENQTQAGNLDINTSLHAGFYSQSAQVDLNAPLQNSGTFGVSSTVGNDQYGLYSTHALDVKFDNDNLLGLNYNSRTQELNATANLDNVNLNYTKDPSSTMFSVEAQNDNSRLHFGMNQNNNNGTRNHIFDLGYNISDTKDDSFYNSSFNAHYDDKTDHRNLEIGVSSLYGSENTAFTHNITYSEQQTTPGTSNSTLNGFFGIEHNFNLPDNGTGSVSAQVNARRTWYNALQNSSQSTYNVEIGANLKPTRNSYIGISTSYPSRLNRSAFFNLGINY